MTVKEFLFRGKRIDNGKQIEGLLTAYNGRSIAQIGIFEDDKGYICCTNSYGVIPETICRYSELTDKNKSKIFENDIVKDIDSGNIGVVKFGLYNSKHYGFYIEWIGNRHYRKDIYYWATNGLIEVIGNVYDNSGVLKEGYV